MFYSRFSQNAQHWQFLMAIMLLMPTLYYYIFAVFFLIRTRWVCKCKIQYEWVLELCILKLPSSLILLISNDRAKTKMAIFPFLYCGEFMKTLNDPTEVFVEW